MSSMAVEQLYVATTAGKLEVLTCSPVLATAKKPPLLCLHGAFSSAEDFRNFLTYFAEQGYPSYALSIRGHGHSWSQSWLDKNVLTTLDGYMQDITSALDLVSQRHPGAPPPVVMGHSFGGGHLQYLLNRLGSCTAGSRHVSGLVLLASAPLSGGGREIMANWEMVEAGPSGYKYPWSPRAQLDTPEQVRAAFFHPETDEEVIEHWLKNCKAPKEGIRIGMSVLWPFGEAENVLRGISGLRHSNDRGRKILCVAGELDPLTPNKMVEANAQAYVQSLGSHDDLDAQQIVITTTVPQCGHHLAMDKGWQTCAGRVFAWMEGGDLN